MFHHLKESRDILTVIIVVSRKYNYCMDDGVYGLHQLKVTTLASRAYVIFHVA